VKAPSSVRVEGGAEVPFTFEAGAQASGSKSGAASKLVIKRPDVGVVSDWSILVA
jgi:alpha 1,3-glucosidase